MVPGDATRLMEPATTCHGGDFTASANHPHHHLPAFHFRHLFDIGKPFKIAADTFELPHAEFLVSHFPTAKPQCYFYLVTIFDEAAKITHFDLVIIFVSSRPKFHFLDLDLLLLLLGLMRLFRCLVLEFADIHDSANRRLGQRRNFYQIQPDIFRHHERVANRDDSSLLPFTVNQAHFRRIDFLIDALLLFLSDG